MGIDILLITTMTANTSRKDLTKVCTLDRDEMTPDEKHMAFLAALYENRDHQPLTTTDIRRATGLTNKDCQYEREKFVELGYIEASRPSEKNEDGRPASYEYWLENDGKWALTKHEFGNPTDLRKETAYEHAQKAYDAVQQAENRLRAEMPSRKYIRETREDFDDLDEYVTNYAEQTNSLLQAVLRALEDNNIDISEYLDGEGIPAGMNAEQ